MRFAAAASQMRLKVAMTVVPLRIMASVIFTADPQAGVRNSGAIQFRRQLQLHTGQSIAKVYRVTCQLAMRSRRPRWL